MKRFHWIVVSVVVGVLVFVAVAAAAQQRVVLGSHKFEGGHSTGFGTAHPKEFFNGGDPSGLVQKIHWHQWGSKRATGRGWTYDQPSNGGHYQRVRIDLRAFNKGRCTAHGPMAYRKMTARIQKKPGGSHYTKWFAWSAKTLCRGY